ncbi:MAG: hypothetical protein U0167_14105 [bacterium]
MRLANVQILEQHLIATYAGHHSDGRCVCAALGFATEGFALNAKQRELLAFSLPTLREPGSLLEMYARTDRTGSGGYNMGLSRRRLIAVQDVLIALGAPIDKVRGVNCKAVGEQFEAYYGMEDDSSYAGGRAVWAFFWPSRAAFDEGPNDEQGFRKLTQFGRSFGWRL